ncbi:MAG TPA: CBS domain-containing protein [Nitrososphaeraceae archaeon]|nr:CBS domain-containing protein [Nitrososphaeraceae archaeon]
MKAYDVMSVDIICAKVNVTVMEIATRIVLGVVNGMPIINNDGKVIGIITTIDLLRAIKSGKDLKITTANEIMTVNPLVINQDTEVDKIIDIMDKNNISMLPVIENDGRIVGICSRSDIIKEILNERFVTIGRKRTVTTTIGEGL